MIVADVTPPSAMMGGGKEPKYSHINYDKSDKTSMESYLSALLGITK